MKKYIILLISFLSLLCCDNIFAQQKKAIYLYGKNGVFDAIACSKIEGIIYEDNGTCINQIIKTKDSTNVIPVSKIDSISFDVPQNVPMQIPQEDLNGWEYGYSLGDEYLVAYRDSTDYAFVMMINKSGEDAENSLILCFNDNYEVASVGNLKHMYDVKYEDDKIILFRINEEGFYEEQVVFIQKQDGVQNKAKKAMPSLETMGNFFLNGFNFISNIQSGLTIGDDIVTPTMNWNWNWAQLGKLGIDSGMFWVGLKVNPLTGLIITYFESSIGHYIKQDAERKRNAMYVDCEISIDEIKPENGNTVVYATVRNANNLPDYLVNMYDPTPNENTRNIVSCGIVVRAHKEFVNAHVFDYKSQETQLNGDIQYGAVSNFAFTIPGLDLTKNLSTFYFRPYLTSTRLMNNRGDVSECHIKYGEIVPYTAFNGNINEFRQYDALYSTDANNYGFVMFQTTINATINSLDDIEEWGIYVYDLNGSGVYDYYPSEYKAAKLEDWIDIDFNINKDEFDEINTDYFLASKKIKIGVYKKIKNPTGMYDYLSYFYSEPQEYELVYDEKPSLTFTSASLGGTETYTDENGEPYYCATEINATYLAKGTFWVNTTDLVVIQGTATDNVGYWETLNDGESPFSVYYQYPYGGDNLSAFKFDMVISEDNRISSTNAIQVSGSPYVTNIAIINNSSEAKAVQTNTQKKPIGDNSHKARYVLRLKKD